MFEDSGSYYPQKANYYIVWIVALSGSVNYISTVAGSHTGRDFVDISSTKSKQENNPLPVLSVVYIYPLPLEDKEKKTKKNKYTKHM